MAMSTAMACGIAVSFPDLDVIGRSRRPGPPREKILRFRSVFASTSAAGSGAVRRRFFASLRDKKDTRKNRPDADPGGPFPAVPREQNNCEKERRVASDADHFHKT